MAREVSGMGHAAPLLRLAPALALACLSLAAHRATAQSKGLVVRDGTLGSHKQEVVGSGYDPNGAFANYLITPDLGEQHDGNLFHSFKLFGIGKDETATFTGPDSVKNVITRVTGGSRSEIDGTLRSTIPGADVWLLNPSGVMFGAGSKLEVPGSFHASTGDYLGFADGDLVRFYADPSRPSVLSTATPTKFGFLSARGAAAIAVDRTDLEVPDGEALELVGGDISLTRNASLLAAGGHVDLEGQGKVDISQSLVDVGRDGGSPGTISIRGGKIVVEKSSWVLAENESPVPPPADEAHEPGPGAIALDASESVLVDASLLSVSTHGAGNAGTLDIASPQVTLRNGPGFDPLAPPQVTQVGASAETTSGGAGGEIRIQGDTVTLANDVGVSASAVAGASGRAGDVAIAARDVKVSAGSYVSAETAGAGDGGTISIEAGRSVVVDDGLLAASTWSTGADAGDAGTIHVSSPQVTFRHGPGLPLFPNSPPFVTAAGARAETQGSGRGGEIAIDAANLTLADGVILSAGGGAGATGDAGIVKLSGGSVDMSDSSLVHAGAYGSVGNAGTILVDLTDTLRLDAGKVESSHLPPYAFFYVGASGETGGTPGSIEIRARSVELVNGGILDASCYLCSGPIPDRNPLSGRSAGSIAIVANSVLVSGGGLIYTTTNGAGDAGTITIDVDSLTVDSGGSIDVGTSGKGKAGTITVLADNVRIGSSDENTPSQGSIVARSEGNPKAGEAGTIALGSDLRPIGELVIGAGGRVDAGTETEGGGGTIAVEAGSLKIGPGEPALINVSSVRPFGAGADFVPGPAGKIDVVATDSVEIAKGGKGHTLRDSLNVQGGLFTGIFSSTVRGGDGGSITVSAPLIRVADGAYIATTTLGGGKAGEVDLTADRIRVVDGGSVDSTSLPWSLNDQDTLTPSLDAGSVTLVARKSIEVARSAPEFGVSRVSSMSLGSGASGLVTLEAPRIVIDGGAVLTTALPSGDGLEGGQGGAISLQAFTPDRTAGELLVTNGGRVDASTFINNPGGSIHVAAGDSILVSGMGSGIASRTGGRGDSGAVALNAPVIEVNDGAEVSARSTSETGFGELDDIFTGFFLQSLVGDVPAADRGKGNAGEITLVANRVLVGGGTIAIDSSAADGGDVTIEARKLVHLDRGVITASVNGGLKTTGGNITIDPAVVLLENWSSIVATAKGSNSGGKIEITANNYFAFPGSKVSAEADRQDLSGTVEIHAPDVDLTGNIMPLPTTFLDASSLLRERCAARRSGEPSGSFAVRGPGGIPAEPDGWLRAPVLPDTEATAEDAPSLPLLAASLPGPLLAAGSCE